MSNGLAISTVSAAFQQRLLEAVSPQVGDVKMRLGPPTAKLSSDGVALVNVHLFRVEPNSHNANTHLATRTSGGAAVAPAQLALNLHYVVSFYGNYEDHEPDRMLAAAMIALEAEPALSRRTVLAAIEVSDMLEDSDLLDALARLRVTRQLNTLDDFSKIWSIFYQVPYAISLVYEVAHVVIEEDRPRAVPLPVAQPKIWAAPTPKLRLDSIAAHGPGGDQTGAEPRGLATWGAPIVLRGKGLGQSGLTVFIDDLPVAEAGFAPSQSSQWGAQITVSLLAAHLGQTLPSGMHRVQVGMPPGPNQPEHLARRSNAVALALHPTAAVHSLTVPAGAGPANGEMVLTVSPPVSAAQRVTLLLDGRDAADPASYALAWEPPDPAPAHLSQLGFDLIDVPRGTYLLRVDVDGLISPVEQDPASGEIIGPEVTL